MVKNNNPNYKNDSGICKGGEDGIGCKYKKLLIREYLLLDLAQRIYIHG